MEMSNRAQHRRASAGKLAKRSRDTIRWLMKMRWKSLPPAAAAAANLSHHCRRDGASPFARAAGGCWSAAAGCYPTPSWARGQRDLLVDCCLGLGNQKRRRPPQSWPDHDLGYARSAAWASRLVGSASGVVETFLPIQGNQVGSLESWAELVAVAEHRNAADHRKHSERQDNHHTREPRNVDSSAEHHSCPRTT